MKYQRNEHLENMILQDLMQEITDESRQHPSVTDLIYCLTKSFYDMQLGDKKPDFSNKTKLFFVTGLGLERVLLEARKEKPTVGEYEGIHYHVDSLNGVNTPLMELKTTRKSIKTDFADMPEGWFKQAMAYCKANGLTKIEYAILFIIPAELVCYDVEFTQEEVDSNWEWLQGRKGVWNESLANGTWPKEYMYNEPWECNGCKYSLVCEARSSVRK